MVARQGSPESLSESYTSRRIDRLTRFVARGRAGRDAENVALADLVDRARGLGCPSGDMRLAYGWRAAVIRVVLVAVVVGLGSRVALTGLFVEFVTDGVVPVAGFNAAVTVLATLTLGFVHARGVPFAGSHRLIPGRRSISHGDARWSRWSHTLVRRRHRWTGLVARYMDALGGQCGGHKIHTLACRSAGVRASMTAHSLRWCRDRHLKGIPMAAR